MRSSKYFIIMETALGILVLILAAFMLGERYGGAMGRVSVIVRDSDSSAWAAFKYGLRMAAQERGIEVVIVATESLLTLEEEESLIMEEIENGADAVIVQPVPGEGTAEMLKRVERRVPVILVENLMSSDGEELSLPFVGADDYTLGRTLAEEILEDYGGNMAGKTIGILSQTMDSETTSRRAEGLCDALKGTGVRFGWSVAGNFEDSGPDYLEYQAKVDCVASLDDRSLTMAGECSAAQKLQGARVYGVGHSTKAAYYLDIGAVECLVVPDGFGAGYQSMSELADCLEHFAHRAESRLVSHTVIRRDELFLKENQEILFTMSR